MVGYTLGRLTQLRVKGVRYAAEFSGRARVRLAYPCLRNHALHCSP